jgi:hypothetical protein
LKTVHEWRSSVTHQKPSRCLLLLGIIIGLASFAHYYSSGLTTAHYDAKAHLVVARRIVDSAAPGYLEMGMNWLPLTHLLYLPFVLVESQYKTGFIPSLLSVTSFVLSGWLVFQIALRITQSVRAGIFAGIILLANPNLEYLQSCPLTEPLFMVLFLYSIERFLKWRDDPDDSLPWMSALGASLSALCRYEGWFLLAGILLVLLLDVWTMAKPKRKALQAGVLYLALFIIPMFLHFGYIYAKTGNSFLHQVARGNPAPFETHKRPLLSLLYHLGELSQIATLLPLIFGMGGLIYCCIDRSRLRKYYPLVLLWVPSLINVSALSWGMVYRIRYSVLLLPAIAVLGGLAALSERMTRGFLIAGVSLSTLLVWIASFVPREWQYHDLFASAGILLLPVAALLLFLAAEHSRSFFWSSLALCVLWMHLPVTQGEAKPILSETLEHDYIEPERQQVLHYLKASYDDLRILLDMSKLAPLAYDSALPLKNFISNEGDRVFWRKVLESPESWVGWICVQKGDEIWYRLQVDPHWLDKYSLAVQTDYFRLYRLKDKYRTDSRPGGRLQ